MTGSVAIDVAIGLVFVYLLYSLFATIICEIVANYFGLRARNLRESLIRLLEDDSNSTRWKAFSVFQNLYSSLKNLFSRPGGEFVKLFYEQATIKYLARNNFFSSPSYISPANFSKAIIEIFREKGDKGTTGQTDLQKIKEVLENQHWIDDKTRKHILSLLIDANDDLVKFKILLERWYDSTMERAIGWYKQKIQVVLLTIGLFIAISFNVNTFHVVNILSKDDTAREQLVKMATGYIEQHKEAIKNGDTTAYSKERLDSLLYVKKQLDKDIASANSIMGLGWPPDSVELVKYTKDDSLKYIKNKIRFFSAELCNQKVTVLVPQGLSEKVTKTFLNFNANNNLIGVNKSKNKAKFNWWSFLWASVKKDFWGYLITAFAISLGSPFWFDLLNKLVQIRGSIRQPVNAQTTTENDPNHRVDPLLIKG
jgi:hypothetical protein